MRVTEDDVLELLEAMDARGEELTDQAFNDLVNLCLAAGAGEKVRAITRRVRTSEGARKYGQPIGSIIRLDPLTGKPIKAGAAEKPAAKRPKAGEAEPLPPAGGTERRALERDELDELRAVLTSFTDDEDVEAGIVDELMAAVEANDLSALDATDRDRIREAVEEVGLVEWEVDDGPTDPDQPPLAAFAGDARPSAVYAEREARLATDAAYRERFERALAMLDAPVPERYAAADPTKRDPVYGAYVRDLNRRLAHAMVEPGPVGVGPDGVTLTPEGQRMASTLARAAFRRALDDDVPRESRAIFAAGISGAGKSTSLAKDEAANLFGIAFVEDERGNRVPGNFAIANADDFKTAIPMPPAVAELGIAEGEATALAHELSSAANKEFMNLALGAGLNVIVDGTFESTPEKRAREMQMLKDSGYTIDGMLVDGEMERSLDRAAARHTRRGDSGGGDDDPYPPPPPGGYSGRYVPYGSVVVSSQVPDDRLPGVPPWDREGEWRSANAQNFQLSIDADLFDSWVVFDSNQQVRASSDSGVI